LDISSIKNNLSARRFDVPDQSFRFECASLRPYTRYFVVFEKLDYSNFCVQDGKRIGSQLITDGYGKLNFTFYWSRSNENAILQNKNFAKYFDTNAGNKLITITDKTGTSYINKTIFFTNNTPDIMITKYTNASNIVLT
jgi:hypothetical protein